MDGQHDKLKIFSGNANRKLTADIAKCLDVPVGKAHVNRFSDGEVWVNLEESVRGWDCFIVQSTCAPVNDTLMELLIMADAMKRASAGKITAVIPYFGYARQDRKPYPRTPISAKLVANMIASAGINAVLTMDIHARQIQGFFDIPIDNLEGKSLFVDFFRNKIDGNVDDYVVVSPDFGSVSRARLFAEELGISMAIIDKRRAQANQCEVMNLIGNVRGKKVIIIDDMIDTAGTLCNAAQKVIDEGALEVRVGATHAVLSGKAIERINSAPIEEIALIDTIPIARKDIALHGLTVIPSAPVFAEAISHIFEESPISPMYAGKQA